MPPVGISLGTIEDMSSPPIRIVIDRHLPQAITTSVLLQTIIYCATAKVWLDRQIAMAIPRLTAPIIHRLIAINPLWRQALLPVPVKKGLAMDLHYRCTQDHQ